MCGVFAGLQFKQDITPILIESLRMLEYRGYDSAGIATVVDKKMHIVKGAGDIDALAMKMSKCTGQARIGMGHTRWATHGKPTDANAHPHRAGHIALVHNGIIENHESLRVWCQSHGYHMHSSTDTEVIACMLDYTTRVKGMPMLAAIDDVCKHLEGQYSFVCMSDEYPDELFGICHKRPLLYGRSEEGMYISSDLNTLARWSEVYTKIPEDEAFCCCLSQGFYLMDKAVQVMLKAHNTTSEHAVLCGHDTFMFKEIGEQPERLQAQAQLYQYDSRMRQASQMLLDASHIHIIACGSSHHAALVARYWYERWLKKPCHVEIASEYRYREPVIPDDTCMIVISQSGETADTIAAVEYAKGRGVKHIISFCNVETSYLAQHCTVSIPLCVGVEMGVASTKAFTGQLFGLLSLGRISVGSYWKPHEIDDMVSAVRMMLAEGSLWQEIGEYLAQYEHVIYIGRDHLYPIALEGALKLKEISYIHAEAYSAGELKHGPLALIDDKHPTIALVDHFMTSKMKANIDEIKSRSGHVIEIEPRKIMGNLLMAHYYQRALYSIIVTVPLQLISYYTAQKRQCNVDKPRNLAKCVTVE